MDEVATDPADMRDRPIRFRVYFVADVLQSKKNQQSTRLLHIPPTSDIEFASREAQGDVS